MRLKLAMRAFLAALLVLVLAAPAAAAPLQSDNVSLVGKLPDAVGAISARFSPDGATMYVSTVKGLHTYDVRIPERPQPLGFLPLPHFENEDVDAGDGVVIVSNDPGVSLGVVYIVDVRNPRLPAIRSVVPHGSTTGHIGNCLQGCRYMWTTGSEEGIAIWDLADLDAPKLVKSVEMPAGKGTGEPGFTHDVFVDRSQVAWITGEDGTFGFDATDPVNPKLVYRSDEDVVNSGNSGPAAPGEAQDYPLDFLHHNAIRTGIQLAPPPAPPAAPSPPRKSKPRPAKPSKKALKRKLRRCGSSKRCKAKARKAYRRKLARWRKATRRRPVTTPGGLGDVVAVTEEDYTRPTCNGQGSLQTWQIAPGERNADGSTKLKLLDSWTSELNGLEAGIGRSPLTVLCSAHWFDEDRGLLAQGWYDQGVRFLDINDPTDIRQVGYYVTAGTFWGAYYAPTDPRREIVYGLDVVTGIDVLRIDRSGPMLTVKAPVAAQRSLLEHDPITFDVKAGPRFGYACLLLRL